jgi:hypothetical protein
MVEGADRGRRLARAVRWVARLGSLATIVLVLLFLVGEGFNPSPKEWLGFLFFPVGICVGMVIAWWKEGAGGAITVASLLAFYGVHLGTAGRLPTGWAWLLFATPGFLFLLSWHLRRAGSVSRGSSGDS